jgi:hypothetical protein
MIPVLACEAKVRSACLFVESGTSLGIGDDIYVRSNDNFFRVSGTLQHELPNGKRCIWLCVRSFTDKKQKAMSGRKTLY